MRAFVRVVFVAGLVALAADVAEAQTLRVEAQQKVLDNGLTVIVWERPSAGRIGARMFYRVDIAAERPGTAGLTHMLEHFLFKGSDVAGTSDWEKERAIAERIERLERDITDEKNRNRDCFRQREVFAEVERECDTPRLAELQRALEKAVAEQDALSDPTWYDWAVQSAGGSNSTASTGRDWMKFDIDLPANKLELFLWTERARLEHPVFRQFEAEREVVVDQIRRYDNRPDGKFSRALRSMTYDAHPYGWAHWFSDLTRATREDHWEIFHKYFIPQNAIVVVVGEVKAEAVFEKVDAYFGDWLRGRPSPRLRTVEPPPVGERRTVVTAAAGPSVVMHARMPAIGHPDAPVFEVLAELLDGPQGRLRRVLVDERALATSTGASAWTSKYPSHFEWRADARSNGDLDALERGLEEVVAAIGRAAVEPAEIRAAASRLELTLARSLDEIGNAAVALGSMEAIHRWDHLNELPALWVRVTAADLSRIVQTYFASDKRVVGILRREETTTTADAGVLADPVADDRPIRADEVSAVRPGTWPYGGPVGERHLRPVDRGPARSSSRLEPGPQNGDIARQATLPAAPEAGDAEALAVAEPPWYAPPWMAGQRPSRFASPSPTRRYEDLTFAPSPFLPPDPGPYRVQAATGPAAFVVEDALLPMAQIALMIDAPSLADPAGKEGLAGLVASLLQRADTAKRTRQQLQTALDGLGASMRVSSDRTGTRVDAVAPAAGAVETLQLVLELVTSPRFDGAFEAERERTALAAERAGDSAGVRLQALFDRRLYGGDHPMGRRPTAASVRAIGLDDAKQWLEARFRPRQMVLAVSGPTPRADVERVLAAAFADTPADATSAAPAAFTTPAAPRGRVVVTEEIDTRQGHVMLGHLGIGAPPDDHASLEVMHYILAGGGFVSRMMKLLRTDTGITAALYGDVRPGRSGVQPYSWRFSGQPETLARGIRLALEQIRTMRDEGVTEAEFEAARTAFLDGLIPASYETSHKVAERLAEQHLFGLYTYQSPQYLNYYAGDARQAEAMRRLTRDDVNRAARKYLHPDDLVIAVAGPLARIQAAADEAEKALVGAR
jgi:predicted Zn-dependent peptidase